MKDFLGIFIMTLVFCYVATFFFAGLILENIWVLVTVIAFVFAVFLSISYHLVTRVEELEKQVRALEEKK